MISLHLCHYKSLPIFTQLQTEEAILRTGAGNWCIINEGTPAAIVMGISGKADELIDFHMLEKHPMPIIRRFSGGGTVVVEEETVFVTFIFEKADLQLGTCPQELLQWTSKVYSPLFSHTPFAIRENDYAIADKKIGGNAQYFTKNRALHHTSFLWNFCPERMQVLKMPEKRPQYRQDRSHSAFLTTISSYFERKEQFVERLKEKLASLFHICPADTQVIQDTLAKDHRKTTAYVIT